MTSATAASSAIDAAAARALLKALADPLRLQIVTCLAEGERCVCDLTDELDLAQSRLSFHLKVLKDCGLLSDRQSGRWVYYRLQPDAIEQLQSWLGSLTSAPKAGSRCCDG